MIPPWSARLTVGLWGQTPVTTRIWGQTPVQGGSRLAAVILPSAAATGGKPRVSGQIQYGRAEGATSPETPVTALPPAPDACHHRAPVRFGRRRTDQVGHLLMSTDWLTFQGRVDLHVPWTDIATVQQAGDDLVVSLHDSRRLLRFCCAGPEDAARAAAVG